MEYNENEKGLLEKKLNDYGYDNKDFKVENEIMVNITLNEYRKLVVANAESRYKINEKDGEIIKLKAKNRELEEDNATLKNTISNLVSKQNCENNEFTDNKFETEVYTEVNK